jgi:hypothetical protein
MSTSPPSPSGPPAPASPSGPAADPAGSAGTAGVPARPVPRAGALAAARSRLAALLLGAAAVAWTATPLVHTGLAQTALVIAIIAVVGGALRLAFAEVPVPQDQYYLPGWQRTWLTFLSVLRICPWEEVAVTALLWLEIQHSLRPWHTAALGAALTAYLLSAHIAESGADAGPLLRRQGRLLTAGACLLALGAGLAMIGAAAPGAGSALLRVVAAVAVVAAAALVLPS